VAMSRLTRKQAFKRSSRAFVDFKAERDSDGQTYSASEDSILILLSPLFAI